MHREDNHAAHYVQSSNWIIDITTTAESIIELFFLLTETTFLTVHQAPLFHERTIAPYQSHVNTKYVTQKTKLYFCKQLLIAEN